jgi:hypothetical protein
LPGWGLLPLTHGRQGHRNVRDKNVVDKIVENQTQSGFGRSYGVLLGGPKTSLKNSSMYLKARAAVRAS